jgi:hypothetical protein
LIAEPTLFQKTRFFSHSLLPFLTTNIQLKHLKLQILFYSNIEDSVPSFIPIIITQKRTVVRVYKGRKGGDNLIDKKKLIIPVFIILCLTVAVFPNVISSQPPEATEYDPWIDYNDDGKIGHKDLLQFAATYGSSGDPTKKVEVTNWPISRDVPVYYNNHLTPGTTLYGGLYSASGFGHLHVLAYGRELSGSEKITVEIVGKLCTPDPGVELLITVYSFELDEKSQSRGVTIPVPSEKFTFAAITDATSDGYVYLSFYLTWA